MVPRDQGIPSQDYSSHIKEDKHQGPEGPISLPQEQEGVRPPRQDVLCQKFWLSVWGHFSVTLLNHTLRLAHPVSDYFCYSMGAINSLFHSSLFLGLVFTFFICFRIICIQYGGGSFLALVLRTKFFFKQGLLMKASMSELSSSYSVRGLFSRTVEAAAGSGCSLWLTYPGTVLFL